MPHHWLGLAAGRICQVCHLVQVKGEYEEGEQCLPGYERKPEKPTASENMPDDNTRKHNTDGRY